MYKALLLSIPMLAAAGIAQTPEQLLDRADKVFLEEQDMARAEVLYREIMDHPQANERQRARAWRYMGACLGRQRRFVDAVDVQAAWLKEYPGHKKKPSVLYWQADYLQKLGREKESRKHWLAIVEMAPESNWAKMSLNLLDGPNQPTKRMRKPFKPIRYAPGRILLADAGKPGGYLVVKVALTDVGFLSVADDVARYHRAKTIEFDGKDFDGLAKTLAKHKPENVLFVVSPLFLDVNFHRKVLMLSTAIDADIFPDFSFGYLTARDAKALWGLWHRTSRMHEKGLRSKVWYTTGVTSGMKSSRTRNSTDAHPGAAGFVGNRYYFGTIENEPNPLDFATRTLKDLQKASVITMNGCGDPQGIWLFNDDRNRQDEKHWDYEPEKVGHDPDGEMPRITAKYFRKLQLQDPIIWSGVCHQGALSRVYVENDITSTFGRVKNSTLHMLPTQESVSLAMIDAGATAFICPIADNHGMSVSREVRFSLTHGASLGETVKSTYDDVYLATRGKLELGIQVHGEKRTHPEYVMQGGGANRILIGDPALKPFEAVPHPKESITIQNKSANGFDVVVVWKKGFHASGWDMFARRKWSDWTIRARVSLDKLVPVGRQLAFEAKVDATDQKGKQLPYTMTHSEPEVYHGHRYLHLQANVPRDAIEGVRVRAVFRVKFK